MCLLDWNSQIEGQVITQNGIRIAYLQQNPAFPEEKTVLSYVTDGMWDMDWTLQSEAKSMLNQLDILDHEQPLAELFRWSEEKGSTCTDTGAGF